LARVLLIEDDPRIARFVKRGLEAEGYAVEVAGDGAEGLEFCRAGDYAIVILDRMLPELDGIEVCRLIRTEHRPCMILMLTAKDALQDKLEGLRAGADDYLTKPFAFDELLARLHALLRRGQPPSAGEPVLRVADLVLDPTTRKARRGEREISLTVKEYLLLSYLMENKDKVASRTRILNHIWGYGFDPGTKIVDVYIRYLRQKIDQDEAKPLIKTVRGFGYIISDE
jgi:two-component system, OmpR family, response regulator